MSCIANKTHIFEVMMKVGDILVSDDIKEVEFVCHLEKCKGACCVEGDLGAPLEESELAIMEEIQEEVRPYLTQEGIRAIEEQGPYILDEDGDYSTPTIGGKECAYAHYDSRGILKCGIEQAHLDGKINFRKPISCHLYPVRISKYKDYDAVNFHTWDVCKPACECGSKLDVPVYKFLREPLIRKYGKNWYKQLELADKMKKEQA